MMTIGDGIEVAEFVARRGRVMAALEGACAVVFAGEGGSLHHPFEPDWNFYYVTGIRDEPGAAVVFDPRHEDVKRRCVLFLRPRNPEAEEWDGYRDALDAGLRSRTGFETVMRTGALARVLTAGARRSGAGGKTLACLQPFAVYDAPVTPDLAVYRKVAERVVGVKIEDRTDVLARLRAVKSAAELGVMRKAAAATAVGFAAAARAIRPGVNERDVQRALEAGFVEGGGTGTGYRSIVGAGLNSTVLHYHANDQQLEQGELVLIDAAARVSHGGTGGYTADVTRTFPVSGRFTPEQREVYGVVLRAMEAAIAAVRPGAWMWEVDAAARAVIEKAGYGDAYVHGIGHQLGIEVHDATPEGPLMEGMVVTIEPGVYLKDRKLGIRIEDDVVVRASGALNLTAAIPRDLEGVEGMMRM